MYTVNFLILMSVNANVNRSSQRIAKQTGPASELPFDEAN